MSFKIFHTIVLLVFLLISKEHLNLHHNSHMYLDRETLYKLAYIPSICLARINFPAPHGLNMTCMVLKVSINCWVWPKRKLILNTQYLSNNPFQGPTIQHSSPVGKELPREVPGSPWLLGRTCHSESYQSLKNYILI